MKNLTLLVVLFAFINSLYSCQPDAADPVPENKSVSFNQDRHALGSPDFDLISLDSTGCTLDSVYYQFNNPDSVLTDYVLCRKGACGGTPVSALIAAQQVYSTAVSSTNPITLSEMMQMIATAEDYANSNMWRIRCRGTICAQYYFYPVISNGVYKIYVSVQYYCI